jgi:hypothetical protein
MSSQRIQQIDWQNMKRAEPLVATVANMRKCEGRGHTVMLDANGDEWSATAGDYFMRSDDEVFEVDGVPSILVQTRSYLVHPLTGEVI